MLGWAALLHTERMLSSFQPKVYWHRTDRMPQSLLFAGQKLQGTSFYQNIHILDQFMH